MTTARIYDSILQRTSEPSATAGKDFRLVVTLPDGDELEVQGRGDGIEVRNTGRRRMSGLTVQPRASNSIYIAPAL